MTWRFKENYKEGETELSTNSMSINLNLLVEVGKKSKISYIRGAGSFSILPKIFGLTWPSFLMTNVLATGSLNLTVSKSIVLLFPAPCISTYK